MIANTPHIAVLTGDIIGSTQMAPADLERAFDALAASAEVQAARHGESLHFTRQRGDGWQVRLARPDLALRSALAFRAALRCEGKEFETFIAAAEGPAAPMPAGADLNQATDDVFVESGRLLDFLKESHSPAQMGTLKSPEIAATFTLADHISQSWTPAQAAAILPMLSAREAPSYTELALQLGKSRQAVTKALEGAGFSAVFKALYFIEREETPHD